MKRIISFVMALALMFTMSVSAFAAEGKGTITVTNATVGQTYTLYKIFDASPALDDQGQPVKNADGTVVISYTMEKSNQFFEDIFGATAPYTNDYFTFTPIEGTEKGNIARKSGVTKEQIQTYLKGLIDAAETAGAPYTTVGNPLKKETATTPIEFKDLPYGYYLIDSDMGSLVTLTSTAPDANVIDKNQKPGTGFDKLVYDEKTGTWVPSTSANIGDILKFEIGFEATNYNGEFPVEYYSVADTKGSSLWVEFNSIKVELKDKDGNVIDTLDKGYYHFAPAADSNVVKTNEWTLFGTGWTQAQIDAAKVKDAQGNTQHAQFADEAEWYLIHRDYDKFDIVIPWMTNHDFTGEATDYKLEFVEKDGVKPAPHYPSPVQVVVSYTASVEPSATIGKEESNTLWNTARLTWKSNETTGPDPETTLVYTYALGLLKTDSDTQAHLAGAVFELYREKIETNADGEQVSVLGDPVYVIPTDIKGVYIVDDLNTVVSGEKRESARKAYEAFLAAYLNGATQKNTVTTEANGKLVIKGLEEGNYYLKEVKAPDGYNLLPSPTKVTVGSTNEKIVIVTDPANNTSTLREVYDTENASGAQVKEEINATIANVPNSKGVELPSTGGEGTFMLITMGTLVAIAFAALLITHKKMSVYVD